MNEVQQRAMRGMIWSGIGSLAQQVLNLVLGICLARLLTPDDYGMVGMLAVFSAIAGSLQESGFTAALANRKEVRHEDYNAVFWCSLCTSIVCYTILFFCAPLIADFYHEPELLWLSRYLFAGFVIASTGIAPSAYLFKNLMVKQRTLAQVPALIISGTAGVALAFCGYGCWALATQTIIYVGVCSTWFWWMSGWRPTLDFNMRPVREMFGFSSRLLATNIFVQIQDNVATMLLGRFFTKAEVGQYTQSAKWNLMASNLITTTVGGVAQPALSATERDEQLELFRAMLRATAWLSFPALLGLALVAKPFIIITITAKWLPCVPLLQILCLWGALKPINHLLTQLAISRGRSGLYMWTTVAVAVCQVTGLLLCRHSGIETMVWCYVAINTVFLLLWTVVARRLVGLRLWMALSDAGRFALAAALSMGTAWWITQDMDGTWLLLAARIAIGGSIYLLFTHRQLQTWARKLRH